MQSICIGVYKYFLLTQYNTEKVNLINMRNL